MPLIVYAENAEGRFKKSTFEVVSYGRALADKLQTSLTALVIGQVQEQELLKLGTFGIEKVLYVNSDRLQQFDSAAHATVLVQAVQKTTADLVLFANTFNAKTLAPLVAARLKAGLATAVIEQPVTEDEKFKVKRAVFSGKAFAELEITSAVKVLTINLNTFEPAETGRKAEIEAYEPVLTESDFKVRVDGSIKATDRLPLPEAEIIVSGGRGLRGPENWHLIEELADTLGAAIACSKPVSDAGWRPHEEHVGQTGITVSPNLYIAIGISGAIQHIAGISASKKILVINKDPEAPFFKVADYGIVGDAFEVVPKLIESIKEFKAKG